MEIALRWKKRLVCACGILGLLLFAVSAQASWLVSLSDTMSSQATSALSNHTFSFTTRTGAAEGTTLAISFASAFDTSAIDFTDLDLAVGGTDRTLAATCAGTEQASAAVASDVVTFTICTGDGGTIAASSAVTIEIGTNAAAGTTGDEQIRNPGSAGGADITIGGTFGDRGNLSVGIESLGSVTVSGTVVSTGGGGGGGGGDDDEENLDRRAPLISDIQVTDITENGARIIWRTDESADSKVDYGITASYEIGAQTDVSLITNHSVLLTGLTANTTYHYRVRSADLVRNEAVSLDFTFRTAAAPDTTAPVISNVQAIDITTTTATVAWATNEAATSTVEYGLTTAYESGTLTVGTLATEHEVDLSGLMASTLYHYRVRSRDAASNEAVSGDFTFTTSAPPDTTAPTISDIAVADITQTSARVTWRTDETATSEVRSGRTVAYERGTVTDPALVTTHGMTLTGFQPATVYHFLVSSRDAAGNATSSTDRTFTTLPDTTAPTNVTDFRAVESSPGTGQLTWRNPTDDDLAGVRIVRRADRFPVNAADGTTVFDGLAETTDDSGLAASTTYRYGAFAYDTSGNFASGALTELETAAVCGDNLCTSGESAASCPADCRAPEESVCGNTICEADESSLTCPADCGASPDVRCGDGACELGEDANTCPADCRAPAMSVCGNAICEIDETAASCPADCAVIEVPPITVGGGEALEESDLHFLVANQAIELAPTSGAYRVLLGTVLWVRVDVTSFAREPSEVRLVLGTDAYRLAREDAAYLTAILTPRTTGRVPAALSVLYPDGVSDRVDVLVDVQPWGSVVSEPDGATIIVSDALVTLTSGANTWNAGPFGEENPILARADGTFAWYAPNGSYRVRVVANDYREQTISVAVTDAIVNPRIELIELPPPVIETLQDIIGGDASALERLNTAGGLIDDLVDYGFGVFETEVLDNPQAEQATEVVAPTVAVVATASAGAAASAVGFANVARFLFTQPIVFFTRRKRKAWGTVFNAITKVPVDLAVIRLFDLATNRFVQTRVTDREGRYFFVAQPGTYRVEVQKLHFVFPSEYLKGVKRDPLHLDIYHGESVVVSERDATIAMNIPLDPEVKEQVPATIMRRIFWERVQKVIAIASPVIALAAVIIAPTPLTIGLFALQTALYGTFEWIIRPKKPQGWGIVYEEGTRKPLGRAIVRIFEPVYGKLLEMQVTDARGRYSFVVGPNKYKLASEKSGYTPDSKELDYSQKKGPEIVREEFSLKPGKEPDADANDEWREEPV